MSLELDAILEGETSLYQGKFDIFPRHCWASDPAISRGDSSCPTDVSLRFCRGSQRRAPSCQEPSVSYVSAVSQFLLITLLSKKFKVGLKLWNLLTVLDSSIESFQSCGELDALFQVAQNREFRPHWLLKKFCVTRKRTVRSSLGRFGSVC